MWAFYFLFFYLFSRSYLKLHFLLTRVDTIWKIGLSIYIILAIIKVTMFYLASGLVFINAEIFTYIDTLDYILLFFFLFISILAGIMCIRKGYKPAKIYLTAISFYVVFTFITIFQRFIGVALLPANVFTGIDELIMVLIFSVGTARQIKELEQEKINAELAREREHAKVEKAIALDNFKTNFFTNITHEFRTPLTVIMGIADLIKEQPTSWYTKGTQIIKQNGQRLMTLINQILDLSKLEAGSVPVNYIQGDVIQYLNYLVESFQSLASQKEILLLFKTDHQHLMMDFDPDKISTIVSNLIGNAIKFTPDKGKVLIQVKTKGNPPSRVEIEVSDNGPGIPENELDRIFDRFFEGTVLKNQEAGTGVGLSLTREIVHLLKGEISVKNLPEYGAAFTVSLPVTKNAVIAEVPQEINSEEQAAIKIDDQVDSQNKPTVLIVEDSKDVAAYILTLLKDQYVIACAENGTEGLRLAQNIIPDLIISDVMMPIMNGFEMTKNLKTDRRTSHIPIILLTAKADKSSRLEGLETGADAYLSKPFDKNELFIRINKLIALRDTLQNRYRDLAFIFQSENDGPNGHVKFEDAFVKDLQTHLEENISNPDFGIVDLCKFLGLSRAQLYRKFKAVTGQSIGDFIRKVRLHRARLLLSSTNLNISQIAFKVGFKNPTSFSRSFTSEFGVKPSQIRSKHPDISS
ncbi:MAG: response regulator [Saprospiraceae bacterium]|nr:response regulator [Saprospiraceae bacterium]